MVDGAGPLQHVPSVIGITTPLLLGSASPRRRDILTGLGIPIRVLPADVVEDVAPGEAPLSYLTRVVSDKLSAVAERAAGEIGHAALLVADTTVVLDERILGKPRDEQEARELLGLLVGRTHVVYTRYAVSRADAPGIAVLSRTVATRVTMRPATAEEVQRYAATGEGLDKAGAYAAQGIGTFLIERIEGSYSNVVGLPACELVSDLLQSGLLARFP
jgi:septum formation protein